MKEFKRLMKVKKLRNSLIDVGYSESIEDFQMFKLVECYGIMVKIPVEEWTKHNGIKYLLTDINGKFLV